MDIRKITEEAFGTEGIIEFNQITKSLVNLLDINEINLKEEQLAIGLRILRKIVEVENKSVTTPAVQWETSDYSDYIFNIENRQNDLAELDVVSLLIRLFNEYTNKQVRTEAILVMVAMLLGGNKLV